MRIRIEEVEKWLCRFCGADPFEVQLSNSSAACLLRRSESIETELVSLASPTLATNFPANIFIALLLAGVPP
jgi:hypothetical protein